MKELYYEVVFRGWVEYGSYSEEMARKYMKWYGPEAYIEVLETDITGDGETKLVRTIKQKKNPGASALGHERKDEKNV